MTLRDLAHERNARLRLDAIMKAGSGILFTLVLAAPIAVFAWFACAYFFGFEHVTRNMLIATALVVLATFVDAVRTPNPYAGLRPLTTVEERRRRAEDLAKSLVAGLAGAAGAGLVVVSRMDDRSRAGCAAVATAGPTNVIEAFRLMRASVSEDPHVLGQAREVLSRARGKGIDPAVLEPAEAFLVLLELGLLRSEGGRLVASKQGERVLAEG